MLKTQEKMNVIIMRDSGESKRYRLRRSRFRLLVIFAVLSPMVAVAALAGCFYLWQDNWNLKQAQYLLEEENRNYAVTAKRLENLQALLERKKNIERSVMAKVVKEQATTEAVDYSDPTVQSDMQSDGPGHAAFPEVSEGALKVDTVSASRLAENRLRLAFNLHNTGSEALSGEAFAILSLADGKTVPLQPAPSDAGTYKITKFKSAVLFLPLGQRYDLTNAQIILEVKNEAQKVVYRNIFPLSQ